MFMSFFTTFGSLLDRGRDPPDLPHLRDARRRAPQRARDRARSRYAPRPPGADLFVFEGVAYDLIAAAIGVLIGVAVAYGMVLVMASAFGTAGGATSRSRTRSSRRAWLGQIGVLLTLASWRSPLACQPHEHRSAIRLLVPPRPADGEGTPCRWILVVVVTLLGVLLVGSGVARERTQSCSRPGVALIIRASCPFSSCWAPGRARHTVAGLARPWFVLLGISRLASWAT